MFDIKIRRICIYKGYSKNSKPRIDFSCRIFHAFVRTSPTLKLRQKSELVFLFL